jgi:nicotinamidase/pyrazinamidase
MPCSRGRIEREVTVTNEREHVVIVVDVQADFTEYRNGALAISGTDAAYVEKVISRTRDFKDISLPIFATRDYHPADHVSFVTTHPGTKPLDVVMVEGREQVVWPPHCVQGTPGADILIPDDLITSVISTGAHSRFESYSGFRDDGGNDTGLQGELQRLGIKDLIIYGLATDYCVKATVLHALELNYRVKLLLDLSRGVAPDTTRAAIDEMKAAGAEIE